jgi:hypothetical protein
MKPSRLALLAVALAALLAGCSSPPVQAPEQSAAAVPISLMKTGPAVGPDLNATLAAPPRLVEGEWWRIRFDGGLYVSDDLVRVVANATPDGYVFGMPHEGWIKEAIAYHAPAFGDVAPDLSYMVHNHRFEPLRFPLEAGASWPTLFGGTNYTATVESADDHSATIRVEPPPSTDPTSTAVCSLGMPCDGTMRFTYDARVHEVTHMESPIGSWDVVAHGYEFRGWVSVPRGEHTAIDYGTFGPQQDNPLPTRTIHVDDHFNRMTVLHGVIALSPGEFRLTSTAPDGESFVTEVTGAAGTRFEIFEVANPGGEWTQEDLAVGVGATYTMGIAYEQYDILVPSGERRPTHSHEVLR